MALNPKQQKFVEHYLKTFHTTNSALAAGYSKKTAHQQGYELLKKPEIKDALRKQQEDEGKKSQVTKERIIQELARIAFSDLRNVSEWGSDSVTLIASSDLTDAHAAPVSEISESVNQYGSSLKIKQYDKMKALELLSRMLGYLNNDDGSERDKGKVMLMYKVEELVKKNDMP